MSEFGFSDEGLKPKRLQDIRESQDESSKEKFGDDVNLEDSSTLKRLNDVQAEQIVLPWDELEHLYNGIDVRKAVGDQLDKAVSNLSVFRELPKKATLPLEIAGTDTTIVPVGLQGKTSSGIVFVVTEQSIVTGGIATTIGEALEAGTQGNVGIGTVTEFVQILVGLDTITNTAVGIGGQDREIDEALRARYFEIIGTEEEDSLELIRTEILKVSGVESATVIENDTETPIGALPEKTFESIVQGGTDNDVAAAILKPKPAGIRAFGQTTTVVLNNSQGNPVSIGITRPTTIDFWADATVTAGVGAPGTLQTDVQTAVVNYINTLDIGEDVIYPLVIGIIVGVQGVANVSLTTGTSDPPLGTIDIPIAADEIARTDNAKIDISVV